MSIWPGFIHLCACVRHRQTVSVWDERAIATTIMRWLPWYSFLSHKSYQENNMWFGLNWRLNPLISTSVFHFLQKIRGKISCTVGTVISSRVDDLSFACTLAGDYVSRVAPVTNNWMANKNLIKINQTKKRQSSFTAMSLSLHSHLAPRPFILGIVWPSLIRKLMVWLFSEQPSCDSFQGCDRIVRLLIL